MWLNLSLTRINIFFSIESPFIWEDDGVLLDEYVSSEFRLSSGKDKITIGSRPDLQQNAIEEISFGSNNNENGGILINKLGDSKDILIDLRNLYYDDQLANGKEFDIILNNFKVDELKYADIKAGVNEKFFPINFKMTVDNTIANDKDIILTHSFFNFISGTETESGSLKMNLVLRKQSNLVYKLESLNFKAEAGTKQINQFITIPLEQPDFISIVVKPNDFSAINGLQEIKKINKSPKMEIESTYSSDIFDDSKIDDGKTTSNFSKIKIDLYNRLTEQLFKTETFKKMGASPDNFNPPIFSFEYLNENDYSNGYGREFDIILL